MAVRGGSLCGTTANGRALGARSADAYRTAAGGGGCTGAGREQVVVKARCESALYVLRRGAFHRSAKEPQPHPDANGLLARSFTSRHDSLSRDHIPIPISGPFVYRRGHVPYASLSALLDRLDPLRLSSIAALPSNLFFAALYQTWATRHQVFA
jgi:hypothetical protein